LRGRVIFADSKTQRKQTGMLGIDELFKGRHFDREIIILCVRWYLRFKLSFRDLVEMMTERGIDLAHTIIMRWIQRYVAEFERRWNGDITLTRRDGFEWYWSAHDASSRQLQAPPISSRDHRTRSLALFPFSVEPAPGRGNAT
jgi:transposase-like protein